ncbi:MAG: LysR family transcriptional regulator [Spongiibacteraceae bacterium]|nr:LysR family transcriptional regulator [Spongiibacteraceae bacterium]
MSRWEGVEVFAQVVASGTFSKAAEVLGVSKSHVSRQVSQLEERLAAQLLNRTTRKVTTTEMGQAFYLRCKDILAGLEEAEKAVLDLQEAPQGILRMTVAGAFGERYVAPAAADFMLLHPRLRIDLTFTNRTVDLIADGYDLAIRAGALKDSSMIARRIAARKLTICASPGYVARYGQPESIVALKKHNCLLGTNPTWRFREQNNHHSDIKLEGNWRSNNGYALLQAARKGLGLVQLPEFYVIDDIEKGNLVRLLEQTRPTDTAVWAVYPSNRHLSAKVRLFVEFLVERFTQVDGVY